MKYVLQNGVYKQLNEEKTKASLNDAQYPFVHASDEGEKKPSFGCVYAAPPKSMDERNEKPNFHSAQYPFTHASDEGRREAEVPFACVYAGPEKMDERNEKPKKNGGLLSRLFKRKK